MAINGPSLVRLSTIFSTTLIVAGAAIWGALALWYKVAGARPRRTISVALWSGFSLVVLAELWQGGATIALALFAAAFGTVLTWWLRIVPSNQRIWADELAQLASGTLDGSCVTLHNVRNFDWRSRTEYTQRWETRRYDLDQLQSVDMIMSYWTGPAIAHMLISFGFGGGDHVVFSVEIRRQKNQRFSEIGGFFKEFELIVIAADERDVIRVRTDVRGEETYLYRLQLPVAAMRSLFLSYIDEINTLVQVPRFYNTISVNCTTLVYQMMKRIVGRLPFSYRLLFSGYLPAYVYRAGGLDRRYSLKELRERGRISERARRAGGGEDFSTYIRKELPGL
jgi:Domain of unknown function (DUF4105)